MRQLTCPKCKGDMRVRERSDIAIDICNECGGVFLDRGELEKIMEAEAAFHEAPAPSPAAAPDSVSAAPISSYTLPSAQAGSGAYVPPPAPGGAGDSGAYV